MFFFCFYIFQLSIKIFFSTFGLGTIVTGFLKTLWPTSQRTKNNFFRATRVCRERLHWFFQYFCLMAIKSHGALSYDTFFLPVFGSDSICMLVSPDILYLLNFRFGVLDECLVIPYHCLGYIHFINEQPCVLLTFVDIHKTIELLWLFLSRRVLSLMFSKQMQNCGNHVIFVLYMLNYRKSRFVNKSLVSRIEN